MATTSDRLPVHDLMALNAASDPHPLYAAWRAAGPLVKGGIAQWGVTRHADVSALLKDRRLRHAMPKEYTDLVLGAGPTSDFRQNSLLMQDGPAHLRLRRLMAQAFTPQLVQALEGWVESVVEELTEPLRDGAVCNLVDLLAFPLPTAVICELMSIPLDERDEVRAHSAQLLAPDTDASDASVVWFRTYMEAVLRRHRPDGGGDLLDRMLAAGDGPDALSHDEIVDNAILLFFAGFETTRHLIASAGVALARRPDQWALLRAQRQLTPYAVEELLRHDTPIHSITALASEPIELGSRTIKAGQVLHLLLACANRDETVFSEPDELDITRSPNPHVAFGGGAHRCLGMHLARLEASVVLRSLAHQLLTLELVGEPRRGSSTFGAYEDVPVRGRPA